MKKIFSILFVMMCALGAWAQKNLEKDITMVSYEQRWLDDEGTLALKNNTNEEVKNMAFLITYLDMSGTELDYKEYTRNVNIAPGMTRKVDIPAYEHERHYHYYLTKDDLRNPAFKIKFELKDYNMEEEKFVEQTDLAMDNNRGGDSLPWAELGGVALIGILVVLFALGVTVGLYVIVAVMAKQRHRNIVLWLLLSILTTPLVVIIILLVIGKSEEYEIEE